jgi:hypothetical protein
LPEEQIQWRAGCPGTGTSGSGRGIGETAEEQSLYGAPVPTSRDPSPSPEDILLTETIRKAGELADIQVLDHLIIGQQRYVSLKERRLGFD